MSIVNFTRVPAALAMAVVICGCAVGSSTKAPTRKAPVTQAQKVAKIDSLTKALSLSNNTDLSNATAVLESSLFGAPAPAAVAPGAQSNVSAEQAASLASAFQSLQAVFAAFSGAGGSLAGFSTMGTAQAYRVAADGALKSTYSLAATLAQGNTTLIYDDTTKELTAIKTPGADIALAFQKNGRTGSLDIKIPRSTDGTTAEFFVQVTGDWKPFPTPAPVEPIVGFGSANPFCMPTPHVNPGPTPTPPILAGNADGGASDAASSDTGASGAGGNVGFTSTNSGGTDGTPRGLMQFDDQACNPQPAWTPPPPPSPPPFTLMGGEYPSSAEALTVRFQVTPKGNPKLAMSFEGTFDDPETVTFFTTTSLPMHWAIKLNVPRVAVDWDSKLHMEPGKTTFDATGSLAVTNGSASDRFTLAANYAEAKQSAHFELGNDEAKVKVVMDGTTKPGAPTPQARLISTEDNAELGTVALDPSQPRIAVITLKDGTKKNWELYPANFSFFPLMAPPMESEPMPHAVPHAVVRK